MKVFLHSFCVFKIWVCDSLIGKRKFGHKPAHKMLVKLISVQVATPGSVDATGKYFVRKIYNGIRRLVVWSRSLGDLQFRTSTLLRLLQSGGHRDDSIETTLALSGGLSFKVFTLNVFQNIFK
jgi:hypothetical protein